MKKFRYIALGAALMAVTLALAAPAYAALTGKQITVYTGISIFHDDQPFTPTDANGKPVEAFVYNGTTYLPVRAISGLFDTPIQWDGATSSVYLGAHSSEKPAAYLADLEYFDAEEGRCFKTADDGRDNLGNPHTNILYGMNQWGSGAESCSRTYMINGQYTKMTGVFYRAYENRDFKDAYWDTTSALRVYGDGALLYSAEVDSGVKPIEFSVDLTGVLELRVEFGLPENTTSTAGKIFAQAGDVALWH